MKRKSLLYHFKHIILPLKGNNHHPHVLKREIVLGMLALILVFEVAVLAQGILLFRNPNFAASVLPAVVADLTNTQRTDNSLQPLTLNPLLSQAAQAKADDMASKGYFSHVSPDGSLPWYWFTKAGYAYQFAGENLAVNFNDSSDVVNAWMASPLHRANILKQDYTEEGIGIATGMYEGHTTTFVVQFFAQPKLAGSPEVSSADVAVHTTKVTTAPTELMTTSASPIATAVPSTGTVHEQHFVQNELPTSASSTQPAVLGVETVAAGNQPPVLAAPSLFQRMLASPFSTANLIFMLIAAFFMAVLAAGVVYRRRLPRMTATIGGLAIIVVVLGFSIANEHFLQHKVQVDKVSINSSHSNLL